MQKRALGRCMESEKEDVDDAISRSRAVLSCPVLSILSLKTVDSKLVTFLS